MFIEQLTAPKNIDKNIFGKYSEMELKQHEKEIDRKVYKFYGLTEEKIRFIEQNKKPSELSCMTSSSCPKAYDLFSLRSISNLQ